MADETKQRRKRVKRSSGRATPKSTPSSRYTPPVPNEFKQSSRWVAGIMFGFFAAGVLVIILNYLPSADVLLPGGTDNKYLLLGLVLICIGFAAATQYH